MAFSKKNNFLTIGIPIFNGGEFIEKRISNTKKNSSTFFSIINLILDKLNIVII